MAGSHAWAQELLVAGRNGSNVVRYDLASGAVLGTLNFGSAGVDYPRGICVAPDGNILVSWNRFGDLSQGKVMKFSRSTGALLGTFVADSQLGSAEGIAIGPDGNLYVAANNNIPGIYKYNGQTGAFLGVFATGAGISSPEGIAFSPSGELFVANFGGGNIARFRGSDGAFLGSFTSAGQNEPNDIVFDNAGSLYVSNYRQNVGVDNTGRITKYDATTFQALATFTGGLDGGFGVDVDASGNLYTASYFDNRVVKFPGGSPSGATNFAVGSPITGATFLRIVSPATAAPEPATLLLIATSIPIAIRLRRTRRTG